MYEPVQEFEAFQNYTNSKYSSAGTISQKLEEMEKKDKAISNTISMFFFRYINNEVFGIDAIPSQNQSHQI